MCVQQPKQGGKERKDSVNGIIYRSIRASFAAGSGRNKTYLRGSEEQRSFDVQLIYCQRRMVGFEIGVH